VLLLRPCSLHDNKQRPERQQFGMSIHSMHVGHNVAAPVMLRLGPPKSQIPTCDHYNDTKSHSAGLPKHTIKPDGATYQRCRHVNAEAPGKTVLLVSLCFLMEKNLRLGPPQTPNTDMHLERYQKTLHQLAKTDSIT
jgi:hypothetical protein